MRILVVEDDPATARLLCDTLTRRGHDPVAYSTGIGALAAAGRERFDLMISDLMLPDFDGVATIAAVRRQHPHMPVIVVSALEKIDWEQRCREAGAACFLQKPLHLGDLVEEVSLVQAAQVNLTIGILDADEKHRNTVSRDLQAMGCTVQALATSHLRSGAVPPRLTLLLVDAAQSEALEALRWATGRRIAAIVFGKSAAFDDDVLLRAGASLCVHKPIDAHALVAQARFLVADMG